MNYSKIDIDFDIMKFVEKQLKGEAEFIEDESAFIIENTYNPNFDGLVVYPKSLTNGGRDEVAGDQFATVDNNFEPYKRYGATKLLMMVYSENKLQARNRAARLMKDDYENEPQEKTDKFPLSNLDYDTFSKYLIAKYIIASIDKSLYRYDQGVYTFLSSDELEFIMMDNLENSKINQRKEISKYIQKNAPKKVQCNSRYILFNNGIYDLLTKSMLPLDDNKVFLNKIPFDYIPNAAEVEEVSSFFKSISCGNEEIETLLVQIIGYCMYRSNKLGKFFILKGSGGNGKSTLFEFMKYVLGYANVSELSLDDLSEKFGVGRIRDRLVNLGDDVDDRYIERLSNVKKLATGETISTEEKYKNREYFKYYGVLVFTANAVPRMNDSTHGLKRRLIIVPLEANFKDSSRADVDMKEKICTKEAAEFIISRAIKELHVILNNKQFIQCKKSIEATEEYNRENNPVLAFLDDFKVDGEPVSKCYQSYLFITNEANCKPLSKIMFSKRVQNEGYVVDPVFRDGKTVKVFKLIK